MKIKHLLLLAAALLSGCAATGDDYIKGSRPSQTAHPTLGTLSTVESDLLGPDSDGNGVRDEVDAGIRARFAAEGTQSAAARFAQSLSKAMIAGQRGQAPTAEQKMQFSAHAACLDSLAPGASQAVRTLTTRTSTRAAALERWTALAGSLSAPADPCAVK